MLFIVYFLRMFSTIEALNIHTRQESKNSSIAAWARQRIKSYQQSTPRFVHDTNPFLLLLPIQLKSRRNSNVISEFSTAPSLGNGGTPPKTRHMHEYEILAMCNFEITENTASECTQDEFYDMRIVEPGPIGLELTMSQDQRLMVKSSEGQASGINPGDFFVSIDETMVECSGLQHASWLIQETPRPTTLRFRRSKSVRRSFLQQIVHKSRQPIRRSSSSMDV